MEKTATAHAEQNAQNWMGTITELVNALPDGGDIDGKTLTDDQVRERIEEAPLSVEVRSGWYSPGSEADAEEYKILLSTGGPALRITGELDRYGQPENARLEYQDWGTPWTEYRTTDDEDAALLTFAQQFYFGEG